MSDDAWLESLKVPASLSSVDYEYSADRRALEAVKAVPGASALCAKLTAFALEGHKAELLGRAVKVSAKQFPEIDRLRLKAAEVLGISAPPVFVLEAPVLNAFTLGPDAENSFIILTRALVQEAKPRELLYVIGHEMGHVKSRHSLYITVAVLLANTGLFAAGALAVPGVRQLLALLKPALEVALFGWLRRAEISCDRAGLIASQDLPGAQRALLLLACGSRDLADRIDLEEYEKQRQELSESVGKWRQLFQTHPHLPKRVKALELFAGSAPYGRLVSGAAGGPDLASLDAECAKVLDDFEGAKAAAGSALDWGRKVLGAGLGAVADGLAAASETVKPSEDKGKKPRGQA
ncbi:MAG: M48 family metallopeptidase [Elusimicrobia bacterium]|nr:M48 family metallopeptidase [Elusimicrobiota bacterium]